MPSDLKPLKDTEWKIYSEGRTYYAILFGAQGEILLRSPCYTALSGVKSAIESIKKNLANRNFALSVGEGGKFFFKLYSSSTRLLCISETYSTADDCLAAAEQAVMCCNAPVVQ